MGTWITAAPATAPTLAATFAAGGILTATTFLFRLLALIAVLGTGIGHDLAKREAEPQGNGNQPGEQAAALRKGDKSAEYAAQSELHPLFSVIFQGFV